MLDYHQDDVALSKDQKDDPRRLSKSLPAESARISLENETFGPHDRNRQGDREEGRIN